jgi:hypothetical protein
VANTIADAGGSVRDDRGSHFRHEHQFLQAARRCVRPRRPPRHVAEAHELVGCFLPNVRRSPAQAVLATTSMVTSPSARRGYRGRE